jgi:hypothetical protein
MSVTILRKEDGKVFVENMFVYINKQEMNIFSVGLLS